MFLKVNSANKPHEMVLTQGCGDWNTFSCELYAV